MRIKGTKIKNDRPLQSGTLYEIKKTTTISFVETETNDVVKLNYQINNKQYGLYGNEYKHQFAGDECEKKADILALLIDENSKEFVSWVIDVKKNVGGEDVVYHLIEQLLTSIKHKNAITVYLNDYTERENIGYITRDLNSQRIIDAIEKKRAYIDEETKNLKQMPLLIGNHMERKLLEQRKKLKLLIDFINNTISEGNYSYTIKHYQSRLEDENYIYNLNIEI